jgi:hypothetical protein
MFLKFCHNSDILLHQVKNERRVFMIYAQVSDDGLKLVEEELKSTKDAKWYRRLKIIQWSSQGETVPQLSKRSDVCEATVRDYIKRYNSGGLGHLSLVKAAAVHPPHS